MENVEASFFNSEALGLQFMTNPCGHFFHESNLCHLPSDGYSGSLFSLSQLHFSDIFYEATHNGTLILVLAVDFDHSGSYLAIAGTDIR